MHGHFVYRQKERTKLHLAQNFVENDLLEEWSSFRSTTSAKKTSSLFLHQKLSFIKKSLFLFELFQILSRRIHMDQLYFF